MSRWIILLRGINVGGHRKVPMNELKVALDHAGFEAIATYIQSGNVVLDDQEESPSTVRERVAVAIQQRFGFDVAVIVRSAADLTAVADSHHGDGLIDPKLLHVVFFSEVPSPDRRAALDVLAAEYAPDTWSYSGAGRELFVAYPDGSGRSKFGLDVVERTLGVTGTARNLNTVRRLIDLAQ
ncbi:MAG TPA: DUF1697 domain-containing protein [Ilumatobacter sp.]|nr:DUF1697 domain-containing protein [Ilumatobacter sp.]